MKIKLEFEGSQWSEDDVGERIVLVGFRPVVFSVDDYNKLIRLADAKGGLSVSIEGL